MVYTLWHCKLTGLRQGKEFLVKIYCFFLHSSPSALQINIAVWKGGGVNPDIFQLIKHWILMGNF